MSHTEPPDQASAGHAPGADDEYDGPDPSHDTSDVNVRAIIGFAVGMFVVTAVVFMLMYGLFWYFARVAAKNDPPLSPLAPASVEMPRSTMDSPVFGQAQGVPLLTHEPSVLAKQRMMEQEVLDSYGWVDQKSGIARIPISEAKKLILQRGLPARAEGTDQTLGTRRAAYGESSGGRAIAVGSNKKEEVR